MDRAKRRTAGNERSLARDSVEASASGIADGIGADILTGDPGSDAI